MKNRISDQCYIGTAAIPAVYTAATDTSSAIDTKDYDNMLLIFHLGAFTATGTLSIQVTECATTGGSYTNITAAVSATHTTTEDDSVYIAELAVRDYQRFLKIAATTATDDTTYSISYILYNGQVTPVTQLNTEEYDV